VSSPTSTASGSDGRSRVQRLRVRANAADLALYKRTRALARTPDIVRWVRRYSRLGEHGAVWFAVGAAGSALDAPRRERWTRATIVVGAAYMTSTSIKLAIGRRRPVIEDLPHLMATPTGLSFPSSHATSSFAAARAFGPLLPSAPLYAAALAMGFSRLYLGVHYPSDVAAGAALGAVMGSFGR
jgi:membrane-associated phospholipid phosphatase